MPCKHIRINIIHVITSFLIVNCTLQFMRANSYWCIRLWMKLECAQRAESFDFSLVLFTISIYHFIMKVLLLRKRRQTVNIDQLLYRYIIDNTADITKKWFSLRCQLKGELYSASHLSEETKTLLTEQHTFTNITIASAFLEDQTDFQENMAKWAQTVAKNRVEQDVQVHEVVEAISNSESHSGTQSSHL